MRIFAILLALALFALGAWHTSDLWLPKVAPKLAQIVAKLDPTAVDTAQPTASPAAGSGADSQATPQANTADNSADAASIPATPQVTQQQAEKFVATLTESDAVPVTVERADHFVTGEQMLSLVPQQSVESTTVDELTKDSSLSPDTPITVVREVEEVERVTPERLIAQSAGNLDAPVQVLRNNQVRQTTVREVLEQARLSPQAPIEIVKRTEYYEQTTPRELALIEEGETSKPIKVIRKHHGLEASSIADLMRTYEVKSGSMFYVRTVRSGDAQGIWGIVHDGIIDNFARGMAIRRGKEINTYQVNIPTDADERRADTSSSYLGRLIFNKSKESHVYNFKRSRMGRNPNQIFPGQEIVIIDFQPEELIEIYKHFVDQRG